METIASFAEVGQYVTIVQAYVFTIAPDEVGIVAAGTCSNQQISGVNVHLRVGGRVPRIDNTRIVGADVHRLVLVRAAVPLAIAGGIAIGQTESSVLARQNLAVSTRAQAQTNTIAHNLYHLLGLGRCIRALQACYGEAKQQHEKQRK